MSLPLAPPPFPAPPCAGSEYAAKHTFKLSDQTNVFTKNGTNFPQAVATFKLCRLSTALHRGTDVA